MKDSQPLFRIKGSKAAGSEAAQKCSQAENAHAGQPDLCRMMDNYGTGLLRLCFMYLKDMHMAEDAVQETFLRVYKNYHKFDGGRGEKTWVTRIAINVCKDILRSAWHRRVNITDVLDDIPDVGAVADAADKTLLAEVMNLKPKYRQVLLLFYYEDMKIADIAKLLRTPESTISVRLKRARAALKNKLGGWYYADEEP